MPLHPEPGRLGLLMDLLEHEVAEMPLVGHMLLAAEKRRAALLPRTAGVVELNPQRTEQGHLPILHGQNRARETGQGRRVAGAEKLPLAQTDQQGAALRATTSAPGTSAQSTARA